MSTMVLSFVAYGAVGGGKDRAYQIMFIPKSWVLF